MSPVHHRLHSNIFRRTFHCGVFYGEAAVNFMCREKADGCFLCVGVCVCPGSQGVFCEVQPTDHQRLEFLTKLGFLEILRGEARSREGVVLGRLL